MCIRAHSRSVAAVSGRLLVWLVALAATPSAAAQPDGLAPLPLPLPLAVETSTVGPVLPAPQFSDVPVPASPGCPGDCLYNVRYWIVSSRGAPQDPRHVACGHLDVFERRCDGSLCRSGLANLQSQLIPGAPILLFMHGSYVSWEDNVVQSDATWRWIRCACPQLPLNVICFTWPSDRTRCLLAPCELKRQGVEAEVNAFYAASLLAYLPDCHPVCLMGHSYGARMAMATLHLAGGGALHGLTFGGGVGAKRLRAVLAAGALDHDWLNADGRYCQALCRAECVLNLRNRHDVVLKGYPLLRPLIAHRAIGASGVTNLDRRQQPCTGRIHDLDVTQLIEAGHFWPNYYEAPQLARRISGWVYFPDVNRPCETPVLHSPTMPAPLLMPTAAAAEAQSRPAAEHAVVNDQVATSAMSGQMPRPSAAAARPRTMTPTTARSAASNPPRLLGWLRDRGD